MSDLAQRDCVPCKGDTPPLSATESEKLLVQLANSWDVINNHHIEREFKFKNFREALLFTNKIGELAEEQGHHPDIELSWGRVKIKIWTHKIDGLTESDFILAAKIDRFVE